MEQLNIHWFPGHMMKTLRLIEAEVSHVDMVIELLDARVPGASHNPEFFMITASKPRLLLLTKSDLADMALTDRWISYYKSQGFGAIAVSCKDKKTAGRVVEAARQLLRDKLEAQNERGMTGAKVRAMILGIPNVGKSTLINTLAGGAPAKVEDRPGVTRGKQWVSLREIELLDMPGVLRRKFENPDEALRLAFTGAIRDDILDRQSVVIALLDTLREISPQALATRYKLTLPLPDSGRELLDLIARRRGMLLSGGVLDLDRAAAMLLDEMRGGKLGRLTFEVPPQ